MKVAEQYELTGGEIQNIAKKSFSLGAISINTIHMLCENQLAERIGMSNRRIGI